jgi:hypothetical protein
VRQAEAKKWRYFNAPAFGEPSGSAKYIASDIPSWKKLTLDIAGIAGRGEDVEIEMRAGKKSRVEMWLDEVRVE